MKSSFAICAVFAGLMLAGCGRPSLVGTWEMQDATAVPGLTKLTATFEQSGALVVKATAGSGPFKVTGKANGTYTLEGDRLTVKIDKMDLGDLPEEFREFAEDAVNQQAQRLTGRFGWKSGTSFSVGENDQIYTFERVDR